MHHADSAFDSLCFTFFPDYYFCGRALIACCFYKALFRVLNQTIRLCFCLVSTLRDELVDDYRSMYCVLHFSSFLFFIPNKALVTVASSAGISELVLPVSLSTVC